MQTYEKDVQKHNAWLEHFENTINCIFLYDYLTAATELGKAVAVYLGDTTNSDTSHKYLSQFFDLIQSIKRLNWLIGASADPQTKEEETHEFWFKELLCKARYPHKTDDKTPQL